MLDSLNHLDRFNIVLRANSFLSSSNSGLSLIEGDDEGKHNKKSGVFDSFFASVPITFSQLDRLYLYTIYNEGPFSLIDFVLENSIDSRWIETKLSRTADQIENYFQTNLTTRFDDEQEKGFHENWIKKQKELGKAIDSDILSLRTMETLILLAVVYFQKDSSFSFHVLETKLMDWSEGAGLLRSLTNNNSVSSSLKDTSMDIEFNPNSTETSLSFLNFSPNEFDVYLLEKFKGKSFKKFKEIVDIVADRCGIPVESDSEDAQSKHWRRRVKPVNLIPSKNSHRPSSLSISELKSTRFLSSNSSSRQVDLALKQTNSNSIDSINSRRHSETSTSQIIQQTTPTKLKKSFNFTTTTPATALDDSFVILETPPRILFKNKNDLTGSVRRLFQSQPMDSDDMN